MVTNVQSGPGILPVQDRRPHTETDLAKVKPPGREVTGFLSVQGRTHHRGEGVGWVGRAQWDRSVGTAFVLTLTRVPFRLRRVQALDANGILHVKLLGGGGTAGGQMAKAAIRRFNEEDGVSVLLLSTQKQVMMTHYVSCCS